MYVPSLRFPACPAILRGLVLVLAFGLAACESNPAPLPDQGAGGDTAEPGDGSDPDGGAPGDQTGSDGAGLPDGTAVPDGTGDVEPPPAPYHTTARLARPEGLVAAGGHVFVTNTNFQDDFTFGPGFVTVINTLSRTQVAEIPTSQPNPQFAAEAGPYVLVTCTGRTAWDASQNENTVTTDGALDFIPISGVAGRADVAFSIPIPIPSDAGRDTRLGAPGDIAVTPDGRYAYIASGTRADLFKVDLQDRALLRGTERPISLFDHDLNETLSVSMGADGLLYVAVFSRDEVWRLDPANDRFIQPPLSVDGIAGELEGPIDIVWRDDAQHPDVFVLMTISQAVATIDYFTDIPLIDAEAWTTGGMPNRLKWHRGNLYVVQSGENNLTRINPGAERVESPWLALEPGDNPWDMAVHVGSRGSTAYVSNFGSNTISVIDLSAAEVIGRIANP